MSKYTTKIIENTEYKVNRGILKSINKFKEFVGEDQFKILLQGFSKFDLSFEEEEYEKLINIIIEVPEDINPNEIPYHHAEELILFFCEPFIGKYLKQAKFTLNGISSLLQNLNKESVTMLMESTSSLMKNKQSSDVSN